MRARAAAFAFGLMTITACGPAGRHLADDDGTGSGDVDAPVGTSGPEVCNDAYDNDGDGRADCADPDCSGRDGCPVCGSVEQPQATPLSLPDGVSSGAVCSVDADCAGTPSTPNCVSKECHASYTSTLNFIGFPAAAHLDDPTKLLNVCINIEHSYLRDLQIELITPPDAQAVRHVVFLHKFVDRAGGEVYLGEANDSDTAANPVPGTGETYCWDQVATVPMLTAANVEGPTIPGPPDPIFGDPTVELKPGNYKPMSGWSAFTGVELNGMWTMRVTDLWAADNGFMFNWSIKFDPSLISDCSGPIIL